MQVNFKAEAPDDVEWTLTITMSLARWKEVRETVSVGARHTDVLLSRAIQQVVKAAEQIVTPEHEAHL